MEDANEMLATLEKEKEKGDVFLKKLDEYNKKNKENIK